MPTEHTFQQLRAIILTEHILEEIVLLFFFLKLYSKPPSDSWRLKGLNLSPILTSVVWFFFIDNNKCCIIGSPLFKRGGSQCHFLVIQGPQACFRSVGMQLPVFKVSQ